MTYNFTLTVTLNLKIKLVVIFVFSMSILTRQGKGDGRTLPDISPDSLNRFFVGVGPRVAGEVRDMGEALTYK